MGIDGKIELLADGRIALCCEVPPRREERGSTPIEPSPFRRTRFDRSDMRIADPRGSLLADHNNNRIKLCERLVCPGGARIEDVAGFTVQTHTFPDCHELIHQPDHAEAQISESLDFRFARPPDFGDLGHIWIHYDTALGRGTNRNEPGEDVQPAKFDCFFSYNSIAQGGRVEYQIGRRRAQLDPPRDVCILDESPAQLRPVNGFLNWDDNADGDLWRIRIHLREGVFGLDPEFVFASPARATVVEMLVCPLDVPCERNGIEAVPINSMWGLGIETPMRRDRCQDTALPHDPDIFTEFEVAFRFSKPQRFRNDFGYIMSKVVSNLGQGVDRSTFPAYYEMTLIYRSRAAGRDVFCGFDGWNGTRVPLPGTEQCIIEYHVTNFPRDRFGCFDWDDNADGDLWRIHWIIYEGNIHLDPFPNRSFWTSGRAVLTELWVCDDEP